ncbi:hypothetical protein Bca52824_057500 [Brassica carinata]|uniref:Uncharacterized protein n=1 Tax=Brassica carinata TaxID=52824 RepID=A0A8X7QUT1_BRACI|nr:hypothetical protein Bca52824_057500 [Brassica carinata]
MAPDLVQSEDLVILWVSSWSSLLGWRSFGCRVVGSHVVVASLSVGFRHRCLEVRLPLLLSSNSCLRPFLGVFFLCC